MWLLNLIDIQVSKILYKIISGSFLSNLILNFRFNYAEPESLVPSQYLDFYDLERGFRIKLLEIGYKKIEVSKLVDEISLQPQSSTDPLNAFAHNSGVVIVPSKEDIEQFSHIKKVSKELNLKLVHLFENHKIVPPLSSQTR